MDVILQSLAVVLQPAHLLMLFCGVVMGLAIGILPGLGGIVGMTILLPVIYGIITADTLEQAIERAGTKEGNAGFKAAVSAIEMANLLASMT